MLHLPWKHGRVPSGYWTVLAHRRGYMAWLGSELGFKTPTDWYQLVKRNFYENSGGGLLANYYQDSPLAALREYLPDHPWRVWLMKSVPQGFWQDPVNRTAFMEWLGKKLDCRRLSDWYRLKKQDFYEHGGGGLLANHYGDSPLAALREFKPKHDWKPWLFASVPQGYWQSVENRRAFLNWLSKQSGGQAALTRQDFLKHGGAALLSTYYSGSVSGALTELA